MSPKTGHLKDEVSVLGEALEAIALLTVSGISSSSSHLWRYGGACFQVRSHIVSASVEQMLMGSQDSA